MKTSTRSAHIQLLFALILLLLYQGCSESGLLDMYNLEQGVEIQSIAPGSSVQVGSAIPVAVSTEDGTEQPAELLLQLYASNRVPAGEWILPVNDIPSQLETQDLEPGYYLLDIRVRNSASRELTRLELPFFLTSESSRIQGLSAYPSAALPAEGMIFFADLELPEGADPYLRWNAEGRTISAGLVSEGTRLVSWRVPENEGVYPVYVELFPFPPPDNEEFRFSSSEQFRIEAFVSKDPRVARGEFGPSGDFPLLFHFRGTFDSTGSVKIGDYTLAGEPRLAVESGIFGYHFEAADSVSMEIPPFITSATEELPVTLQLKGLFSDPGRIIAFNGRQGERLMSLERNEEGFSLKLAVADYLLTVPPEILKNPCYLAVKLTETAAGVRVIWYLDGKYLESGTLSGVSIPAVQSTLIIGGGFSGILDEFGLHRGIDPGIFSFAMREEFGRQLILSEGFDTPVSDTIAVDSNPDLEALPQQSVLVIPPGEAAAFLLPLKEHSDGRITLQFTELKPQPRLRVLINSDSVAEIEPVVDLDSQVTLTWRRNGNEIQLLQEGVSVAAFLLPQDEQVKLRILAGDQALSLDWIVIIRGETRIAAQAEDEQLTPEAG